MSIIASYTTGVLIDLTVFLQLCPRLGCVCTLIVFGCCRYSRQQTRLKLPELRDNLVEFYCSAKDVLQEADEGPDHDEKMASIPDNIELVGRPVYLAMVDVTGDEDFLELVKSALLAALEALPPLALFGIVTFSDKVGLHDVRGKSPVVKYVPLLRAAQRGQSPTPLELADAMALEDLLAPVGAFKDKIHATLEGLECVGGCSHSQLASAAVRGFGGAVQAIMRYLSGLAASERVGSILTAEDIAKVADMGSRGSGSEAPPPMMIGYSGARVLCFLAGAPSYGPGTLKQAGPEITMSPHVGAQQDLLAGRSAPAPSFGEAATGHVPSRGVSGTDDVSLNLQAGSVQAGVDAESLISHTSAVHQQSSVFYEEAAAAAAALGVAVDLYAVSSQVTGLQYLEPLASSSGGHLCWYPEVDGSALPQDVYRHLAGLQARNCRLRLRTSPEFKVQHCYGHLLSDQRYDNLQHVVTCGPHDCFAFDFEFVNPAGFLESDDCPPTLQLAFQYTTFEAPLSGSPEASGDVLWYKLQRKMRIHTVQVATAKTSKELYSYSDAESILALLMHKIVKASHKEGVLEARSLLQDWLVILIAQFNMSTAQASNEQPPEVDVTFEDCAALQPIARLVYVLLQSPLLSVAVRGDTTSSHHPDLRCFLQNLWAKLPPQDLQRAVYPALSSWSTPDQQAFPKHSLSRTALIAAGEPIFLLDSFTHLIVYYVQGYPENLPFPPPQTSKLRQTINQLRLNRLVAPQVKMIRGGVDDVSLFTSCLIEEADAEAAQTGGEHLGTFVQFLDLVKAEVLAYLQANVQP
mmetsp:Transcript_12575/g.35332  ORF Transcript_12575/g.35332 Transcript_12575/m.35332 type:complete len:804 (+) Transcript_12575:541-2952(+)